MTTRTLSELLRSWDAIEDDPDLEPGTIQLVQHLAAQLLNEYEPTVLETFENRLEQWLENVDSEREKKILLSVASHLFFVGNREFSSLYRTAFSEICKWITNTSKIKLDDKEYNKLVSKEIKSTWVCPITDSMRINSFLKTNNMPGHDQRPYWHSLKEFSDPENISLYMDANEINRVVLLEDFVGTSFQIENIIHFAVTTFPETEFLICPLIVCPDGASFLEHASKSYENLSFASPLILPEEHFLKNAPTPGEPEIYIKAREIVSLYAKRNGILEEDSYGFERTGAMVVLCSNCPDNTIPLVWNSSEAWTPLFPRVWRPA